MAQTNHDANRIQPPTQQTGAVLIIALLMLLIVTMLGIASMSGAVMQEKMVGNQWRRQQAFQGAESALRFAETWLENTVTDIPAFVQTFNSGTRNELYWQRRPNPSMLLKTLPSTFNLQRQSSWSAGNAMPIAQSLTPGQPRPYYIIEFMGKAGDAPVNEEDPDTRKHAFRVTALGIASDNTTTQVLQSSYRLPLF